MIFGKSRVRRMRAEVEEEMISVDCAFSDDPVETYNMGWNDALEWILEKVLPDPGGRTGK